MRYPCEHCFRAINPPGIRKDQISEVIRCDNCGGLMHAACAKSACSKCVSTRLRKSGKVHSSQRLERRLPRSLIVENERPKESPQGTKKREVKEKEVRKPLSNIALVTLIFTWMYFAILTISMPLVVNLLMQQSFENSSVSLLLLPLCSLWFVWLALRRKRWLTFFLVVAINAILVRWTLTFSAIDPISANWLILFCTAVFLLTILLFVVRSRIKVCHKVVDQVEHKRLSFSLWQACLGCVGICLGATICWLVAYQLNQRFDVSLNHFGVLDGWQLTTVLLFSTGLAITIFSVNYFMLSGSTSLRVLVCAASVGFLIWHLQVKSREAEPGELLCYVVSLLSYRQPNGVARNCPKGLSSRKHYQQ